MTDATARFSLPYIMPAQAQKHLTHNEALRYLDVLIHLNVIDAQRTLPPETPDDLDTYIIPTGAMGDWSGRDGQIAIWMDGIWQYAPPVQGCIAWVDAVQALTIYKGADWTIPTGNAGSDGKSAYDIALAQGFIGTISDWVASLQGPTGPAGTTSWAGITDKPKLYSYFPIWAEENGHLQDNSFKWSFGNGNETPAHMGVVLPFDCELFAIGLSLENATSCEVQITRNGTPTGRSVTTTNATKGYETFQSSAIAFFAGDTVNFHTITGAYNSQGGTVVAWFRHEM